MSVTGISPVDVGSSSQVRVTGRAPVEIESSSLLYTNLEAYPGEDNSILIPLQFSGIMDPIFPPPTPPVDFEGLADPTTAPTLTKSTEADGYLAPGTYRYSYSAWKGSQAQSTASSPTAEITLTTENKVTLTYPTITGADGYLVYREDL